MAEKTIDPEQSIIEAADRHSKLMHLMRLRTLTGSANGVIDIEIAELEAQLGLTESNTGHNGESSVGSEGVNTGSHVTTGNVGSSDSGNSSTGNG